MNSNRAGREVYCVVTDKYRMTATSDLAVFNMETDPSCFNYTASSGKLTITAHTGSDTDIAVHASIDGYTVTAIGSNAFRDCDSMNRVTLTNGLKTICNGAFYDCDSTPKITLTITNTVSHIGDYAFYNNRCRVKLDVYDGVSSIGDNSFYKYRNLETATLPNSLISIGDYAFYYCDSLYAVTYPI